MAKVTTDAIKQIADHVVIRMEKKSGLCKSFDGAYFSRMCIVVCKQSSRPVKVNLSEGGQFVIIVCFPVARPECNCYDIRVRVGHMSPHFHCRLKCP